MYFVTILDKSQFFSKTLPADAGTRLSHTKTKHKKKVSSQCFAGTNAPLKHRRKNYKIFKQNAPDFFGFCLLIIRHRFAPPPTVRKSSAVPGLLPSG